MKRFFMTCTTAVMLPAVVSATLSIDLSIEPTEFTVTRDNLTNQNAVLSWKLPEGVSRTIVYRAHGAGGPWTEVAEVQDAATWKDASPLGVPCYYKIAFASTENGVRSVGAMCAGTVRHRRCQLLERDWADLSKVKDGVTVIWNTGNSRWNGGYDANGDLIPAPASNAESAALAFDNQLNSAPNVSAPSSGRHSVGVHLGSAFGVGFVRFRPRKEYERNCRGITFYGSNDESCWSDASQPPLTDSTEDVPSAKWYEVASLNSTPYRYVYAANYSGWQIVVGELQFYGYPASALDGYAVGAVDLKAEPLDDSLVISWRDDAAGSVFRLECRVGDGEWTTLADNLTATSYTDENLAAGSVYSYRVATVNDSDVVYSDTIAHEMVQPDLSASAADLAVQRSDLVDQYAVLSWTLPVAVTRTVVYRAYGEGGPWMKLAELEGVQNYTDESAPLGVPCYYKIAFAFDATDDEGRIEGDMSEVTLAHRRCQLLERDWDDMTKVKDGVTVIWRAGSKIYNNGNGSTPASSADSAACAFDDHLKTHPNMNAPGSGRLSVGVDLGSLHGIGFVRCYPRNATSGQYYENFNGLCFYGSNSSDSWYATTEPAVTESVVHSGVKWHEVTSIDTTPYRYVYAYNPTKTGWSLTVCEIQFYGWPVSALSGYPVGALDVAAERADGAVVLNWKEAGYESDFRVERRIAGGEWETIAANVSEATYTDTTVEAGTRYDYRVVAVNGENEAYSLSCACLPYVRGDGEGLHTEYRFPYVMCDVGDRLAAVATGTVDIASAALEEARPIVPGVADTHTNVFVSWTGKLIVPFDGTWNLAAEADGMVSVHLDSESILRYDSRYAAKTLSTSMTLAAGEHDLTVIYWQGVGSSGCRLYWENQGVRELIPASQLKAVVPNALPSPWEGAKIFAADETCYPGDVRVNDDGTIDLAFAGADNSRTTYGDNGYVFLWQSFKGDFTAVMEITLPIGKKSGEKGGLMLRAGLNALSPFEAFSLRGNNYELGLRCRRNVGGDISEPDTVAGKDTWAVKCTGGTIQMRLKRRMGVFTFSYRKAAGAAWTEIYTFTDTHGVYGDTVYLGPTASNVTLNRNDPPNANWASSSYRQARYAWRITGFEVKPAKGLQLILR